MELWKLKKISGTTIGNESEMQLIKYIYGLLFVLLLLTGLFSCSREFIVAREEEKVVLDISTK